MVLRNFPSKIFIINKQTGKIVNSTLFFCMFGCRNSEAAILSSGTTEHRKAALSPEKEDRYYTTRGSAVGLVDENGKVPLDSNNGDDNKGLVWPKLYITLSSKEKEEDFMAMKGCKPPQRPKKRAKIIQRSLLVSNTAGFMHSFQ